MQKWLQIILNLFILKFILQLKRVSKSSRTPLRQLKLGILLLFELQSDNILYADTLVLILIVKLSQQERVQMKFVHHIFSTGMPHQEKNLTRPQDNMSETFITLIAEEEIDVFAIGVWKVEFHSSTQKLQKLTGHYQLNGEPLNIKALKNGG